MDRLLGCSEPLCLRPFDGSRRLHRKGPCVRSVCGSAAPCLVPLAAQSSRPQVTIHTTSHNTDTFTTCKRTHSLPVTIQTHSLPAREHILYQSQYRHILYLQENTFSTYKVTHSLPEHIPHKKPAPSGVANAPAAAYASTHSGKSAL